MNKFGAFLFLALVASACADPAPKVTFAGEPGDIETDSEIFLKPRDDYEVSYVPAEYSYFTDFCKTSRDDIYSSLATDSKNYVLNFASNVMKLVDQITDEAMAAQSLARNRLSQQIMNPDAEISEPTNDVEAGIAEGLKSIQEQQAPQKTIAQAISTTFKVTRDKLYSRASEELSKFRERFRAPSPTSLVSEGCDLIGRYEEIIRHQFERFKNELQVSNPAIASDPKFASATIENVKCLTTSRVIRSKVVCELAGSSYTPVKKIVATLRN